MKYLKKFGTIAQYNAYTADTENFILPNVSLIEETNGVAYHPYVPSETRLVAKYNVTDTSYPTPIGNRQYTSGFSAIEIDGVAQPSVVSAYTFSTTGEHTVKYTLTNPTTIDRYAFYNCTSLISVYIPNSVTSIGIECFNNCSGLTSCTIGSGVTSIGDSVFRNCSGLADITIPSGVTTINQSTFYNCRSLTNIFIPNSVTKIWSNAFYDCSGLTSVIIGSGVSDIGNYAFNRCRSLTSINVYTAIPPTLGAQVFGTTNDCPIYVPASSIETYKAASGWSTYADRIQAIQ